MPVSARKPPKTKFGPALRLGALLSLCACIALLSVYFFPPHLTGYVWISTRNPTGISWNTGYGFNEWQKSTVTAPLSGPTRIIDGAEFFQIRSFNRYSLPKAIKVTGQSENISLYYGDQNTLRHADCEIRYEEAGDSCEFKLRAWPKEARSPGLLVLFYLGVVLTATLLGGFLHLVLKHAKGAARMEPLSLTLLSLMLGCGSLLAFIFTMGWPGFQNPYDPLNLLQMVGASEGNGLQFNPSQSPLIQVVWAGLYEVLPSYYFLSVAETAFFLLALLLIAESLWALGWRAKSLFILFSLLLFSPLSITYELFLERSISSAHVNCLLALYFYILWARKDHGDAWQILIFSFLFTLSLALRTDNLPFALCLAVFYGARLWWIRRVILSTLLALGLYGTFIYLPSVLSSSPGWQERYTVESTIWSLTALVQRNPGVLEKDGRARIVDTAVNLDEVFHNLPLGSNHADRQAQPSDARAYLRVFWQIAFEMPETFLSFRWSSFRLLAATVTAWSPYTAPPNGIDHGRLLDMRILPLGYMALTQEPPGVARALRISYVAEDSVVALLALGFLLALVLAFWWRNGVPVVLACLGRMLIVFLLAPGANGFYLFDAYLISCVLLAAGVSQIGVIFRSYWRSLPDPTPAVIRGKHASSAR